MNYDVIGSGKLIHTQVPRASPLSNLFRPLFCSPVISFQEEPKLLIFILVIAIVSITAYNLIPKSHLKYSEKITYKDYISIILITSSA